MGCPGDDCQALLQWALPRLGLRWEAFRKVRRQVCRRARRRWAELGLTGWAAYGRRLSEDPEEWTALARCCRVTISRFYRDAAVFDRLGDEVLPALAAAKGTVRAWSAGCASGEEPYSLVLLWRRRVGPRFPGARLEVVATDAELSLLARARRGVYPTSSLRELPDGWRHEAFAAAGERWRLPEATRAGVRFAALDLWAAAPAGRFDLVLCRNLAFTYFDDVAQRQIATRLARRLVAGGWLVTGQSEQVPPQGLFHPSGPGLWQRSHGSLPRGRPRSAAGAP